MCLDEMWLCLQQQVNVLTAVQLRQLATLQWILFAFQSHKRQPVCLLPQCMQRCVLTIATSMLLTLQIHHRHHHHHNAKRLAKASRCYDHPLKRSTSCSVSVAVTPMSRQIWWIQVMSGRPQARLHSCDGRSPSLVLVQICRIWFAGTVCGSWATFHQLQISRQTESGALSELFRKHCSSSGHNSLNAISDLTHDHWMIKPTSY